MPHHTRHHSHNRKEYTTVWQPATSTSPLTKFVRSWAENVL